MYQKRIVLKLKSKCCLVSAIESTLEIDAAAWIRNFRLMVYYS